MGPAPRERQGQGVGLGGMMVYRDGVVLLVPAAKCGPDAKDRGRGDSKVKNPLAALVKAWRNSRPVFLEAEDRPRTIMRSGLAHVKPEDRRAGRLFAPAAHC